MRFLVQEVPMLLALALLPPALAYPLCPQVEEEPHSHVLDASGYDDRVFYFEYGGQAAEGTDNADYAREYRGQVSDGADALVLSYFYLSEDLGADDCFWVFCDYEMSVHITVTPRREGRAYEGFDWFVPGAFDTGDLCEFEDMPLDVGAGPQGMLYRHFVLWDEDDWLLEDGTRADSVDLLIYESDDTNDDDLILDLSVPVDGSGTWWGGGQMAFLDHDSDGDGWGDTLEDLAGWDLSQVDRPFSDQDGDGRAPVEGILDESVTLWGGDCDDSDSSVFVGAPEVLDDGVDNDCDGEVDERPPEAEDMDESLDTALPPGSSVTLPERKGCSTAPSGALWLWPLLLLGLARPRRPASS